jgi:hypothetical protein
LFVCLFIFDSTSRFTDKKLVDCLQKVSRVKITKVVFENNFGDINRKNRVCRKFIPSFLLFLFYNFQKLTQIKSWFQQPIIFFFLVFLSFIYFLNERTSIDSNFFFNNQFRIVAKNLSLSIFSISSFVKLFGLLVSTV